MKIILLLTLSISFLSCANRKYRPEEMKTETLALNNFFEESFKKELLRHPMKNTYIGNKNNNDQLDNLSDDFAKKEIEIIKGECKKLKTFNYHALQPTATVSYRLFEARCKEKMIDYKYRLHDSFIHQMRGAHTQVTSFMINFHRVDNLQDAQAYILRLKKFPVYFSQIIDGLKLRKQKKILGPHFIYEKAIEVSQNILSGRPFQKTKKDSTLFADFKGKLKKIKNISSQQRKRLLNDAEQALLISVKPAYMDFAGYVKELKATTSRNDGAWALPQGDAYYRNQLKLRTTTDMTPEEIHKVGLSEVQRIHNDMTTIMKKIGFKGNLQEFFAKLKTEPKLFYPQNATGRKKYLKKATQVISDMKKQLGKLFTIKPKSDIIVKAVEPFREKSAGRAFYDPPATDGSRPGIYYVNLYDMKSLPKYTLQALAYHEGIPGHHMQEAVIKEVKGLPLFRIHSWYTAFGEGWALYAEYIPKEAGLYKDHYSDLGRLSMELWRAGRLVVDTGLHHYKWSREKAIGYLNKNTPRPKAIVKKEVERYLVMPGQATAYKIGMLKILELRKKAKQALGSKFDIRRFHDQVLKNGGLPLDLLEEQINQYIVVEKTKS